MSGISIAALEGDASGDVIDGLAAILEDCVAGGASVSFMAPFSRAQAAAFFRSAVAEVGRGETVLLAARDGEGRLVGTVQLGIAMPPNQPHRADVKKLLVHRAARRQGVGEALMRRLEQEARARGRTVLVLDTASGDAERLYTREGWQRLGVIPDYALLPGGGFCDTVMFWKKLRAD